MELKEISPNANDEMPSAVHKAVNDVRRSQGELGDSGFSGIEEKRKDAWPPDPDKHCLNNLPTRGYCSCPECTHGRQAEYDAMPDPDVTARV